MVMTVLELKQEIQEANLPDMPLVEKLEVISRMAGFGNGGVDRVIAAFEKMRIRFPKASDQDMMEAAIHAIVAPIHTEEEVMASVLQK